MKFFKKVKDELKKVKWPDGKYMLKYTIATMVLIIFLGLYFFGITALISVLKDLGVI